MSEDGESLRRRLYRPGARDDDVRDYLAATAPRPVDPAPAPPVRRRRPVVVPVVIGGVLLLLGAVAGARTFLPAAAASPALPTRPVSEGTASGFVAALEHGDDAGLARWWGRGDRAVEVHGSGDGSVLLPVADGGGRFTVLLVLDTDGTAAWSVAHLVIHDDRTVHLETDAGARGVLRAGVPAIGRVAVRVPHVPLRLVVTTSPRTRWGVAAVAAP